jgi:hypothetical protein
MSVIAKARALIVPDRLSVIAYANDIHEAARFESAPLRDIDEPLTLWFSPPAAEKLRRIDRAIQRVLAGGVYEPLNQSLRISSLPPFAAFFYVALFRCVRELLKMFIGSNPTWVRGARAQAKFQADPSASHITETFDGQLDQMVPSVLASDYANLSIAGVPEISIGSSECLTLASESVDSVLSSPPYCTRIDYAVATSPELAVLGLNSAEIDNLRRALIGTTTVEKQALTVDRAWGPTCVEFLAALEAHPSKASRTYYLKNHLQYFAAMYRSLGEIARVLRPGGVCVLVVQDSYYKEIHNDLPAILRDMADTHSMRSVGAVQFHSTQTLAGVNRGIDPYRQDRSATEEVMCLSRN